MIDCHYIISALPDIEWDMDIPTTAQILLHDFTVEFEQFHKKISVIILANDLKNIELYLRQKTSEHISGASMGHNVCEPDFLQPYNMDKESVLEILENPSKLPGFLPEFFLDYLLNYKTHDERLSNIEILYVEYYKYLIDEQKDSEFLSKYGQFEGMLKTVTGAMRARKQGLNLDNIGGVSEIINVIVQNKAAHDFGLKSVFKEIDQLVDAFNKDTLHFEKVLDKLRYDFAHDACLDNPFQEDMVYSYILRLMILERWQESFNEEKGKQYISSLINEGVAS